MTPALAATWRTGASASATATYSTNVDYAPQGGTNSDFVTSLAANFNVSGSGPRVKVSGSVGASWQVYASNSRYNSIAPNVNLSAKVEAIEDFLFVDASANASTSFISPFGPQPDNLANATANRYITQTYEVSPYITGALGSTGISYAVRNQNVWTVATSYGGTSNDIPTTYVSTLNASLTGAQPCATTLEYDRTLYHSGGRVGDTDSTVLRCVIPYRVSPELEVYARFGYERFNQHDFTDPLGREVGGDTEGVVYGAGFQWNPSRRTQMGGFWEHRFFGSSYSWQISHRLPNAAIRAGFTRGINSFPELALLVPAGVSVTQFLDAAFATRIPDPIERAQAVEEFLARTGLPPTMVNPVNFYAETLLLQTSKTVSLVLIGVRNTVTFRVFSVDSQTVTASGAVLPPAFQFGENNTQTGVGVSYARPLGWHTNLTASATYSRTRSNTEGEFGDLESENFNAGVNLNRPLGPRTGASVGMSYSRFQPSGGSNRFDSSSFNIYASISHSF